jgi:hypothetical protein
MRIYADDTDQIVLQPGNPASPWPRSYPASGSPILCVSLAGFLVSRANREAAQLGGFRSTGLCRALLALVALLFLVLALFLATLVLAIALLLLIGALRRLLLLVLPTLTLLTLAGVLITFVHWFPL